ncbi:hypothetical protein SDC9_06122 [bioreactor metagenome]|uniref:G5 domain-containing protein n=1 Tax=bioreactor metagenome TaxID=1076179 RepID=A0A644T3P7_9ZZZZ|nr:VanW family protein [Negativicutes bacterium]
MQKLTVKEISNVVLFLGIIILFSTISIVATNIAFMVTDKVYNGVTVGDIDVGGLSVQEAEAKIKDSVQRRLNKTPITMRYEGDNWPLFSNEITFAIDSTRLAEQAFNVGRCGSVFRQFKERYITIHGGYTVPLIPSYDSDKLKAIIADIAAKIDRDPHNAEVRLDGVNVIKLPESKGIKVNVEQLIKVLNSKLDDGFPVVIDIPVSEIEPTVQTSDINDIDGIIAMYTTQFNPVNENRAQNIQLAANSISGALLRSGEIFSFNDLVGLRIAEVGYKEAPVFIEGKLVPDLGGGVCQVSSTLYNVVLLADMEIVERTSHFRPPGYVPLGQDATVADNLLDFRFRNSLSNNIYILSQIKEDNLTIFILSKNSAMRPDISIESANKKVVEPNIIIKQDPNLDYGRQVIETQGQKGFMISTYRVKRSSGKEVDRELLFTDEFKPEDRVVRVGTRVSLRQAIK